MSSWTLQPGGALFDPPAEVTYPNMSGLAPGSASYFLTFPDGGARLELMQLPTLAGRPHPPALGYAHIAITVGSRDAVDALVARLRGEGVTIRSEARVTGDGYYEAVVEDPEGNWVEITA